MMMIGGTECSENASSTKVCDVSIQGIHIPEDVEVVMKNIIGVLK